MSITNYKDLEVWRLAMDLAVECYAWTKQFPKEELFGLSSQIRRAAVSIPANIAEGQGREHLKEYLHHLSMAQGSLHELQTHIILGQRTGLSADNQASKLTSLTERVSQMLSKLRSSLKRHL